jgi:serine/threonine-protein kinase RsbW
MSADIESLGELASLTVETDIEKLSEVVAWFEQFNRPPLSHRLWLEGQIALVEGFTNVVRHAHQDLSASTPITVEVQISPEMFRLWIWDQGQAFDFDHSLQVVHELTADPDFEPLSRELQWGTIIMLKLITQEGWNISYDRPSRDRNCLKIEKELAASHD